MGRLALAIVRWIMVLPGAALVSILAGELTKLFLFFAMLMGAIGGLAFHGPSGFDLFTVGVVCGYVFVAVGATMAPAGQRYVAYTLASLLAIYAVAQLILVISNLFLHFAKAEYSLFFQDQCGALGAVLAAYHIRDDGTSYITEYLPWIRKARTSYSTAHDNFSTVPGAEAEPPGEPIDYDKQYGDEGEEP